MSGMDERVFVGGRAYTSSSGLASVIAKRSITLSTCYLYCMHEQLMRQAPLQILFANPVCQASSSFTP